MTEQRDLFKWDCPDCGGDGQFLFSISQGSVEPVEFNDCGRCGGAGQISAETERVWRERWNRWARSGFHTRARMLQIFQDRPQVRKGAITRRIWRENVARVRRVWRNARRRARRKAVAR